MASDEEDYYLPPEQVRPFTSGVRRKRVQFVRSSDLDTTTATPTPSSSSGTSIADKYLSIVMKQAPSTSPSTPTQRPPSPTIRTQSAPPTDTTVASPPASASQPDSVQNPQQQTLQPLQYKNPAPTKHPSPTNSASPTPTPPSHLDRTRAGLRYLSTYGWDPDSRLGLGAAGREGIREPIKPRVKHDTAGLGTGLDADGDRLPARAPPKPKVQKLNAKQVRNRVAEERRRAERLRKVFYQSDEVLRYLGEGV
ncbi:uncharacterized protein N7515_009294 [Penicillium bovifimosum]|uniref:G-patch domain-containing protein n=1 Tax=Penicillium bovifimosum TaxID=126998 RepID=A0A9W9GJ08_9EURO|nr:uncharacterized protein N7515_009294 [Penicillium bovifimosum]KAJ5121333.1 hypothetical protein N7515_009294 [Penicillium bovifimosum]